ncbi:MAG TPA: hypothetical protein VI076_15415 [Actinopolymorphaceae bacterium]
MELFSSSGTSSSQVSDAPPAFDLGEDPRITQARIDAERQAIETQAEIERRRLLRAEEAEQRRAEEAARAALAVERRERKRAERAERRRQRLASAKRAADRAVPVLALVGVNALAITGQLGFALEHLSLPGFGALNGWPLAVLFAAVVESIALFLAYHAARALQRRDSAAGKQTAAYLVAAVVAAVNYSHWADPGFAPNATAIVFGLVSLLSPWLWGIHAKATNRDQLYAAGEIDPRGPKLSGARWFWHPVKSLRVIAHASWFGISDPAKAVAAWEAAGCPTAIRSRPTVLPATGTYPGELQAAPRVAGQLERRGWFRLRLRRQRRAELEQAPQWAAHGGTGTDHGLAQDPGHGLDQLPDGSTAPLDRPYDDFDDRDDDAHHDDDHDDQWSDGADDDADSRAPAMASSTRAFAAAVAPAKRPVTEKLRDDATTRDVAEVPTLTKRQTQVLDEVRKLIATGGLPTSPSRDAIRKATGCGASVSDAVKRYLDAVS